IRSPLLLGGVSVDRQCALAGGKATQAVAVRAETGLAIDVQRLRDLPRACRQASQPHGRVWFAPAVSRNTEQVFTLELPAETALTIHPPGTSSTAGLIAMWRWRRRPRGATAREFWIWRRNRDKPMAATA